MTTSADPSAPRDAREAFIGLVRWISRSQSSEGEPQSEATISNSPLPLVELAGDAACCSTRGLAAKKEISPSCVIIRLPWSCAITPTSVLRSPSLKCRRAHAFFKEWEVGETKTTLLLTPFFLSFFSTILRPAPRPPPPRPPGPLEEPRFIPPAAPLVPAARPGAPVRVRGPEGAS